MCWAIIYCGKVQLMTLDSKLKDILLDLVANSPQDTFKNIERGATLIKQCFADEGYREPMVWHDRGDGVKYSDPVMTGQEWYDRFKKEVAFAGFTEQKQADMALEAARKASDL